MPWNAPAQDLTAAQADSLVSYIELLEYDLAMCGIGHDAKQDSLQVDLAILKYHLEIAEKERAKWYQDPRLWFLCGAVAATVVMGATLQFTF